MDNDEKIAYKFLQSIYNKSNIIFEPNGYKKYPDFICNDADVFEVTGLYAVESNKTNIQIEIPIINYIKELIKKFNKKEYGYYLDITIHDSNHPSKNKIEHWFYENDEKILSDSFSDKSLTIDLIKQEAHEEKYSQIYSSNPIGGKGWLVSDHIEAIKHCIEKKKEKISSNETLIVINHITLGRVENLPQCIRADFNIIMIDCLSNRQHEWPNESKMDYD